MQRRRKMHYVKLWKKYELLNRKLQDIENVRYEYKKEIDKIAEIASDEEGLLYALLVNLGEICGFLFALGYGTTSKCDEIVRDFFEIEGFNLDISLPSSYKTIFFKPNLPNINLSDYLKELKKSAALRAKELGIEIKDDDVY